MRLANGNLLRTCRYVFLWVNFGEVSSYLKFTVLDCECPQILGMPFLRRLNPLINWQTRLLSFPSASAHKHNPQNTQTENTFSLLGDVPQPLYLGLAGNYSVREPGSDSLAAPLDGDKVLVSCGARRGDRLQQRNAGHEPDRASAFASTTGGSTAAWVTPRSLEKQAVCHSCSELGFHTCTR